MLKQSEIWILVVVVVLIVLVLLVYVGVEIKQRRSEKASPDSTSGPISSDPASAGRILDERLARGEIDEQEYRRRRDELS